MYYGNSSVTSSQANPTGVWDSKYKGVWHFPNGTSLTVSDSTSNANSTTNNGVSATTGQIDGAGKFVSASSQYISVSPISSLGGASKAVLSAWLKRNASGSKLEVGEDNYPTSRFNMQVWSGNIVYLAAENASFDYGTFTLSDSDTSWHKIDMVYDGTQPTNDTRLLGYLDGVKQTLSFANTIPATLGTAGAFVIGYAPASGPASTVSLWIYDGA